MVTVTPTTTAPPVPTLRWGRTGLRVPRVSLGTWSYGGEALAGSSEIGWSGHDDAQAKAALVRAHALGLTHWDTADVYGAGRAETLIGGMWDAVPRADIVLASKVGWDRGEFVQAYHPTFVARSIDASLTRLRTDALDVFYLHHCNFGPGDAWLDPALEVLVRARDAGKIRFIGLSDWDDHAIMRVIARVDPDVVQGYRNVTNDHVQASGLAAWATAHDVGLAFFSPLRHGLLLGKYAAPTTFPHGDFRNTDPLFRDAAALARVRANADLLRARFGARAPNVNDPHDPVLGALAAWTVGDAPTATCLMGLRNPRQVEAAADAARFQLDADACAWVRALYVGLDA